MTIAEALLTNSAYGYPARGDHRRHTPHILAVVHQTATNPYDGQAMVLRNQRNGAGFAGNTATYYIDPDGAAVHAVDGTKYASWCSAPKSITYLDTTRASIATVKRHFASGYNPNECVWEQFECVGTGTEPWTAAQFEAVAQIIAARAKLSGLPINRETVVPHRDFDTVNRPSDPWPAATREAHMTRLIASAKALTTTVKPSSEADMSIITISILPSPGAFVIPAGVAASGLKLNPTTGAIASRVPWAAGAYSSTAHYDATVDLSGVGIRGNPFVRVTDGALAGTYVSSVGLALTHPVFASARDAANAALDKVAAFALAQKG